jgi:DMATS type aromatic prenyltransferase
MSSYRPLVAQEFGTLRQAGRTRLSALCDALQVPDLQRHRALNLFETVSASWGDWTLLDAPSWPSDITDDGSPFEFSAAFEQGKFELRMLFESQGAIPTHRSTWDAGIAFTERLAALGQADLKGFNQVRELFTPSAFRSERFLLWHATVLRDLATLHKVYFNPELADPGNAAARVDEALERLQMPAARRFLDGCTKHLSFKPRVPYFSIDLEAPESARSKIYVSAETSAQAIAIVREAGGLDPSTCAEWLEKLIGKVEPRAPRPLLICTSFRRASRVPDVTLHVPIRCYADNDADATNRLLPLVGSSEVMSLRKAVEAVSGITAENTRGVLTYASLRQGRDGLRVTGYLAPQLYTRPQYANSGTHMLNEQAR